MTNEPQARAPIVLTIAGFDPSGGAGIIADIRTIEAFECTAVAAVTSITFQNANAYTGALHQKPASVRAQVEAILAEQEIAAVKIGMLATREIVREVAVLIREFDLPAPVIDPVIESTSGGQLMADDAFEVFVTELMPLARLITPNIPEAEKLAGLNIRDQESMCQAAARIREIGARAVLVKGGHLDSAREAVHAIDVLSADRIEVFSSERIVGAQLRGSGCILSSAIAAGFASGATLERAIREAKRFVTSALKRIS